MTAEGFWVGAFVLAVCAALVAGCYQDVKSLLADLFAVIGDPADREQEPAYTQEARKARTGGWTR